MALTAATCARQHPKTSTLSSQALLSHQLQLCARHSSITNHNGEALSAPRRHVHLAACLAASPDVHVMGNALHVYTHLPARAGSGQRDRRSSINRMPLGALLGL